VRNLEIFELHELFLDKDFFFVVRDDYEDLLEFDGIFKIDGLLTNTVYYESSSFLVVSARINNVLNLERVLHYQNSQVFVKGRYYSDLKIFLEPLSKISELTCEDIDYLAKSLFDFENFVFCLGDVGDRRFYSN
jgi:hypothetical protein